MTRVLRGAAQILEAGKQEYDSSAVVAEYEKGAQEGLTEAESAVLKHLPPRAKILVLGCGAGRECFPLAQKRFGATGLDASEKMLEKARELAAAKGFGGIRWICADLMEFAAAEKFDAVWLSEGLYGRIPSRRLRLQTLVRLSSLLAPAGRLLVFQGWLAERKNPFYHNPAVKFLRMLKRRLFDFPLREAGDAFLADAGSGTRRYAHFFQLPEEIAAECRAAGLTVAAREGIGWVLHPLR